MVHILILEDQRITLENLAVRFGRLSVDLVTNSKNFKEYVEEGSNNPELWFLDDRVPDRPYTAGGESPSFIQNCEYLLKRVPDAKVYCISRSPESDVMSYLKEKGIPWIERSDITKIIHHEIPKIVAR